MSSASATARASFLSTSTISRPTPRITRAYAAVAPTSPLPTTPTFTCHLASGAGPATVVFLGARPSRPLVAPGCGRDGRAPRIPSAVSRGRDPLLLGELGLGLFVDEEVRLAAVVQGRPGGELRE